jgi:hypothetical protein
MKLSVVPVSLHRPNHNGCEGRIGHDSGLDAFFFYQ